MSSHPESGIDPRSKVPQEVLPNPVSREEQIASMGPDELAQARREDRESDLDYIPRSIEVDDTTTKSSSPATKMISSAAVAATVGAQPLLPPAETVSGAQDSPEQQSNSAEAEAKLPARTTAFLNVHLDYARSNEERDADGNLTKTAQAAWDRFDNSISKFIERNGFAGLARVDAEVTQAYITRFMEAQGQRPVERDLLSAIGNLDPVTIKLFADLYEKANGIAAVEAELPASILEVHYDVEDQPDIIDPRILIIDHLGRPISVLDEDGEVKGIHDVPDLDFPDPDDDRVGKPRHKDHAA